MPSTNILIINFDEIDFHRWARIISPGRWYPQAIAGPSWRTLNTPIPSLTHQYPTMSPVAPNLPRAGGGRSTMSEAPRPITLTGSDGATYWFHSTPGLGSLWCHGGLIPRIPSRYPHYLEKNIIKKIGEF